MSTELTQRVPDRREVTWESLESGLAPTLERMARPTFLVISTVGTSTPDADPSSAGYFIQFAQGGDEGFRAEAVSNHFLVGMARTTPAQERKLLDLGWLAPDPNPTDNRGNVNWHREWPNPPPWTDVARMGLTTLREVYGVRNPSDLRYKCFDKEGRHFALPALPLDPEEPPRTPQSSLSVHAPVDSAELRPFVEAALLAFLGESELRKEPNGDIPVRFGSAVVTVQVIDNPPRVRIVAPLLWGVSESPELLRAVNQINLHTLYGRAIWTGNQVVMAIDVPAAGITADAVSFACYAIGSAADHFDEELHKNFGGESMFRGDG